MTHAWVIRSGRHGERDAWALQSGCSGGGWAEVQDLTGCSTRDDVAHVTIFSAAPLRCRHRRSSF
jgi:restriction system protein